MKVLFAVIAIALSASGCVSSGQPVCFNKAYMGKHNYDIPVYKIKDGKYLSGYPFNEWSVKSQFSDTSSCDKLKP